MSRPELGADSAVQRRDYNGEEDQARENDNRGRNRLDREGTQQLKHTIFQYESPYSIVPMYVCTSKPGMYVLRSRSSFDSSFG